MGMYDDVNIEEVYIGTLGRTEIYLVNGFENAYDYWQELFNGEPHDVVYHRVLLVFDDTKPTGLGSNYKTYLELLSFETISTIEINFILMLLHKRGYVPIMERKDLFEKVGITYSFEEIQNKLKYDIEQYRKDSK